MRAGIPVAAMTLTIVISGCGQDGSNTPGNVAPPPEAPTEKVLYAPMDRSALGFGLPDVVQAVRLQPAPEAARAADEVSFANDVGVRPILVERGLGPGAVTMEQKSDRHDEIPSVATSAVWVEGVPADLFAEFDPSFYLLMTSVTPEQYRWQGAKPGRDRTSVIGREIWSSDWGQFQLVWYTWGEVLYIVLARNQELLESTLRRMPWPSETGPVSPVEGTLPPPPVSPAGTPVR